MAIATERPDVRDGAGHGTGSRPTAARPRPRSGATSRSSSGTSGPAARLSRQRGDVAQAAPGARRRRRATTPASRRTSTAASTPPPRRPPPPTRRRASPSRGTSARPSPRDRVRAQRHRGHQPRRVLLGPSDTSARRTPSCSRSWSTTRTSSRGSCWRRRRTRTSSSWPSTSRAGSTCAASRCSCGQRPSSSRSPQVSNALGTINPAREMTEHGPRRRGARAHRWRPGGAPRSRGCPGAGRRLLRVLGPQDARPDRLGRALGATGAARGDAPVHGRRRDDPRGPPPPDHVQRRALEVRGGHARTSPRPSGWAPRWRTCGASAWTRSGSTSEASPRMPSRCCRARCPGSASSAHATPTSGRASSPSRCRASMRTTSRRCSTGRRSPSGRATTAPSRSTSGSASPRPVARASTSTRTTRRPRPTRRRAAQGPAGLRARIGHGRVRRRSAEAVRYPVVSHGWPVPRRDPRALPPPAQLRHARAPDASYEGSNPLCGDRITLMLDLDDSGTVADVAFTGRGCAISQASARC